MHDCMFVRGMSVLEEWYLMCPQKILSSAEPSFVTVFFCGGAGGADVPL